MWASLKGLLASAAIVCAVSAQAETLSIGLASFPESLQPGLSTNVSLNVNRQMMDGLTARDNAGKIVPNLAEKWEVLNDTTVRFHLRGGVKFHDGSAFSAEDVKYTLDHALDPKNAYGMLGRISAITEVKIVDPKTVDIVTAKPFPTLPVALADILIEPKLYAEKAGAEGQRRKPVGTGPFEFTRYVPGDRIELKANPNYWAGKPSIDSVTLRSIPEAATRISSLLAGETQIVEEVPVDLVQQVEGSSALKVNSVNTSVGLVLTYDVTKPPFDNPKVREALDYAVDKDLILKEILKGKGEVLQGQLLTSNTFGYSSAVKARSFDPARAKKLLAEAGFPNGFFDRYFDDVRPLPLRRRHRQHGVGHAERRRRQGQHQRHGARHLSKESRLARARARTDLHDRLVFLRRRRFRDDLVHGHEPAHGLEQSGVRQAVPGRALYQRYRGTQGGLRAHGRNPARGESVDVPIRRSHDLWRQQKALRLRSA